MIDNWGRLLNNGLLWGWTSLRVLETLGAANEVIAARTAIIGSVMRNPLAGDHREMRRMVPEKIEAFSLAGSASVASLWTGQAVWEAQIRLLAGLAMRGTLMKPGDLTTAGNAFAALILEMAEGPARLGAAALAPVHRKATSNARRLRRKGGKR